MPDVMDNLGVKVTATDDGGALLTFDCLFRTPEDPDTPLRLKGHFNTPATVMNEMCVPAHTLTAMQVLIVKVLESIEPDAGARLPTAIVKMLTVVLARQLLAEVKRRTDLSARTVH
jgi:hypothetical protein